MMIGEDGIYLVLSEFIKYACGLCGSDELRPLAYLPKTFRACINYDICNVKQMINASMELTNKSGQYIEMKI